MMLYETMQSHVHVKDMVIITLKIVTLSHVWYTSEQQQVPSFKKFDPKQAYTGRDRCSKWGMLDMWRVSCVLPRNISVNLVLNMDISQACVSETSVF